MDPKFQLNKEFDSSAAQLVISTELVAEWFPLCWFWNVFLQIVVYEVFYRLVVEGFPQAQSDESTIVNLAFGKYLSPSGIVIYAPYTGLERRGIIK